MKNVCFVLWKKLNRLFGQPIVFASYNIGGEVQGVCDKVAMG